MNEIMRAAFVAIYGESRAEQFARLLSATESGNEISDVVATAIKSKIKSETQRLEGVVLRRMEQSNLDGPTRERVKLALGIGSRQSGTDVFANLTAQISNVDASKKSAAVIAATKQ